MSTIKPIYLVPSLGEHAVLPDGAIINAGGVAGTTFTVGGRSLLFADGTSTGPGPGFISIDLQGVYANSSPEAFIDFTSGKDLVLHALNDNELRFDAETGLVTITGDLVVQGTTVTVIDTRVDTDRVQIHQSAGTYVPFTIEPVMGITPVLDVVDIKVTFGGASVFTIDQVGSTYIQNLNTGLINGIDLTALQAQVTSHLAPTGIKHTAEQISVDTTGLEPIVGENLQEVVESIRSNLATAGGVRALEFIQVAPADPWTIAHGQNTKRVQVTVWDEDDQMVLPAQIRMTDADTVAISFGETVTGRAVLMLF